MPGISAHQLKSNAQAIPIVRKPPLTCLPHGPYPCLGTYYYSLPIYLSGLYGLDRTVENPTYPFLIFTSSVAFPELSSSMDVFCVTSFTTVSTS
jgi:hypothetical protein